MSVTKTENLCQDGLTSPADSFSRDRRLAIQGAPINNYLTLRRKAEFYNADGKLGSIWPHESYRGFCQF